MKKTKTLVVATLALLFICSRSLAQQTPPGLQALVEQAKANYPKLKEAEALIRANQLRVEVAKTALQPYVTGDFQYRYINPVAKATFRTPDGPQSVQFTPYSNFDLKAQGSLTVYDFGKTDAAIQRAQEDVTNAQHSLELNKHNLAYQIAQLYYGLAYLQRSIAVQDSVLRSLGEVLQQTEFRYKNGDVLELDLLNQQVRIETTHNRKVDLENQLAKQKILLAYLTGAEAPAVDAAAVDFGTATAALTMDGLYQQAQTGNLELAIANDRLRAAQADLIVAEHVNRPVVNLLGAAGFKNGYLPEIAVPKFNVAAGVGISAPLYSGKRYALQKQSARISYEAGQQNLAYVQNTLQKDLAMVLADMASNRQRLTNLQTQTRQADKALEIARTRYRYGTLTFPELDTVQTAVEEVRLSRLSIEYSLLLNALEIKRLTGEEL
ncbi:MAG: TolC family protein [Saprospiraceae bacterium]